MTLARTRFTVVLAHAWDPEGQEPVQERVWETTEARARREALGRHAPGEWEAVCVVADADPGEDPLMRHEARYEARYRARKRIERAPEGRDLSQRRAS